MLYQLKERGKYYELPIRGLRFDQIIYNGLLKVVFSDPEKSFLDFHGPLKVTRYNQTEELHPSSKEALNSLYELFGVVVKDAKADREGYLFILFENGFEIIIEDGPYENWHYTKIDINKSSFLYVHGGVGRTIF
jgi:hypothetical protein